jgi:hypothetical protein
MLRRVQILPQAAIAGVLQPPVMQASGVGSVPIAPTGITLDQVNRIWTAVTKDYPYLGLNVQPGGGAVFLGPMTDQQVVLQPPLFQVRELIEMDVASTARKIASIFDVIGRHLGPLPFVNLGVKLVYHAPAPGSSAVDFIRAQMVRGDEDMIDAVGPDSFDVSVKFTIQRADVVQTVSIEPLRADTSMLFIDLDAQYPGVADLTRVAEQIQKAHTFVTGPVDTYLDRRAEGWTT